jgi:hypothetical protein
VEAIVLPMGETRTLRFNDFTQSADMIHTAYVATDRFLEGTVDDHGPLPAGDRPMEAASTDVS